MRPVIMPANRLTHFYLGGARITDLRGVPAPHERSPEEWLASTTSRFGEGDTGLSHLPDGTLLRDAIEAHPDAWLGATHRAGFDTSTGILVKLLDAGQRLPVHLHPTREFARRHLDCPYGKTEAWYVVEADPGAVCHLGFSEELTDADVAGHVAAQDADALLAVMNRIEVRPGDGVLVPAGLPHATGEGILVVEAQEPTDFSILLEWEGLPLDGERDGHLDLGFPTALQAVDRSAWSADDIAGLVRPAPAGTRSDELVAALPDAAAAFFRVHVARPADEVAIPPGFAIVVVLAGSGELRDAGGTVPLARGAVVAVPFATGEWALSGDLTAVVCRPAEVGPLLPGGAR